MFPVAKVVKNPSFSAPDTTTFAAGSPSSSKSLIRQKHSESASRVLSFPFGATLCSVALPRVVRTASYHSRDDSSIAFNVFRMMAVTKPQDRIVLAARSHGQRFSVE